MERGDVPDEDVYLGAGEVARMLQVSPKTVSRWADRGLIPCVVTMGGHRRFRRGAVEDIKREMYGHASAPAHDDEPT